jgi:hypothetical protein
VERPAPLDINVEAARERLSPVAAARTDALGSVLAPKILLD